MLRRDKDVHYQHTEIPKQNCRDEKYNIFNENTTDGIHSRLDTRRKILSDLMTQQ